jgi:hypothetical protein
VLAVAMRSLLRQRSEWIRLAPSPIVSNIQIGIAGVL